MLLEGKNVVITGGGSGVGRSTAHLAVEEGAANVVILDRDAKNAETVAAELKEKGASAHSYELDVSLGPDVAEAFDRIASDVGPTDTLVLCAGIREIVPPLELSYEEWQKVIDVNLGGTFFCAQAAAKQMIEAKRPGASMITFSSSAGIMAYENRPAYSAAKAGVIHLTKSLARDLGPHGIRVNCIAPAIVRTPFTEAYFTDPDLVRELPRIIPLGKHGEPEQIAKGVIYLASDMADFVTGVLLPIDGGHTIVATLNVVGKEDSPFSKR